MLLEKVTAFITRGTGTARELLAFQTPDAGVQLPAGTVEEGEAVEEALWREVREETGLTDLRLISRLGAERIPTPLDQRLVLVTVSMRISPSPDAPAVGRTLRRGLYVTADKAGGGWTQVRYMQYAKQGGETVAAEETSGWVPTETVTARAVRHFFHLGAASSTPDRWVCREAEEGCDFLLFWTPLPQDPGLAFGQAEWLARYSKHLQ